MDDHIAFFVFSGISLIGIDLDIFNRFLGSRTSSLAVMYGVRLIDSTVRQRLVNALNKLASRNQMSFAPSSIIFFGETEIFNGFHVQSLVLVSLNLRTDAS